MHKYTLIINVYVNYVYEVKIKREKKRAQEKKREKKDCVCVCTKNNKLLISIVCTSFTKSTPLIKINT